MVDVPTPALLVDLDAMERNIAKLSTHLRERKVNWRPHIKGIGVPAIAHLALKAGAIGVTCARLAEAQVMVMSGIRNVLLANQVVTSDKISALARLSKLAQVIVAVDDPDNVQHIGQVACQQGLNVGVIVELDIGLNRSGVEPDRRAVRLARVAQQTKGVSFRGLMGWEGHAQAIQNHAEKESAIAVAVMALTRTAELCRAAGIPTEIVSCGGTATYAISAAQPGVTEIQAGGGILGGVFYEAAGADVEHALKVVATVTSRPAPHRIVVDAGSKAMSADVALPRPVNLDGVSRLRLSAEHTVIELDHQDVQLRIGDRVSFVPGYEDTTVGLHDVLYGVRNGIIEEIWPIATRRMLYC